MVRYFSGSGRVAQLVHEGDGVKGGSFRYQRVEVLKGLAGAVASENKLVNGEAESGGKE